MVYISTSYATTVFPNRIPQKAGAASQMTFDEQVLSGNMHPTARPTDYEIKTGFFGSPRAVLDVAVGIWGVNTLSYLTPSDMALVQKTTGVSIRDGDYYDAAGNSGFSTECNDFFANPAFKAAFDLANSLAELRAFGGPEGSAALKSGADVTAADLLTYMNDYLKAGTSDPHIKSVNVDVLTRAADILSASAG